MATKTAKKTAPAKKAPTKKTAPAKKDTSAKKTAPAKKAAAKKEPAERKYSTKLYDLTSANLVDCPKCEAKKKTAKNAGLCLSREASFTDRPHLERIQAAQKVHFSTLKEMFG